ncbi:hypothetical protein SCHPADRAFT_155355 [Schizopora paradoxa]|uniref:Uncharacterized protein n=1 Tax=Schizopora paradoxa TaxID=27342 RepID=A0A0H2S7N3_9AGAM|nr:hypothetical protein SCHPADRAFT_155355 [Schizopora paradoxa]
MRGACRWRTDLWPLKRNRRTSMTVMAMATLADSVQRTLLLFERNIERIWLLCARSSEDMTVIREKFTADVAAKRKQFEDDTSIFHNIKRAWKWIMRGLGMQTVAFSSKLQGPPSMDRVAGEDLEIGHVARSGGEEPRSKGGIVRQKFRNLSTIYVLHCVDARRGRGVRDELEILNPRFDEAR